jgi:hypothetical protein
MGAEESVLVAGCCCCGLELHAAQSAITPIAVAREKFIRSTIEG